jgi:hypothetical protein
MSRIDLRELADEWQSDILDELDSDAHDLPLTTAERAELEADAEKFVSLCNELGCDETPDGLRQQGENFDPTLIPEDDFEDYARELAEDIGAIDPDASWPLNCIDWAEAARMLAQDYTNVSFDGTDYLIRQ